MRRHLPEILELLKGSGYLHAHLFNEKVIDKIAFLPLGSLLLGKIRNEFHSDRGGINSYFINNQNGTLEDLTKHRKDLLSTYKIDKLRENISHIKTQFQAELPLAVKEDIKFTNSAIADADNFAINLHEGTLLSWTYFINESAATEYFHKIQRERKIWWMKFSLNPGRYFLSDLSTNEVNNCKVQSVKIKSRFGFGDVDLETVNVFPLKALSLRNPKDYHMKDVRLRRRVLPAVVRSEICLESAVLGILMDSVEDSHDNKISINRKIAPYQCSIFSFSEDDKILLELEDLSAHLTNVIRKSGLSTLNLQKCRTDSKQALTKELRDMDRIGIPYSIILEDDSLRTGTMKLRSRDTGLCEIIHIVDVPDYLLKIFNS